MSASKQAGFSLISVLVAVAIIGVMAAIAVPKFTGTIITANTAKIQSDLTTLDAAIAVYELQNGHEPVNIEDLKDYVQDFDRLKPPKGKCKMKDGTEVSFAGKEYSLRKSNAKTGEGARAVCDNHTAGEFGYDK